MRKILVFIGGFLALAWGVSHLFPTGNVVAGFGNISPDNSLVITMEWINEGLTLIFLGLLAIVTAAIEQKGAAVAKAVYIMIFIMLLAMSVLSVFTGYKIDFLPYKLCPFIFTGAGLLILQGIRKEKMEVMDID